MKKLSSKFFLIVLSFSFIFSTTAWSQDTLQLQKQDIFKAVDVKSMFKNLVGADEEVKALDKAIKQKGFAPLTADINQWGMRQTFKATKLGTPVYEIYVQDYAKKGSKDKAAVGQVVITIGKRSEVYSFYLVAPGGNFEKAEEFTVDSGLKVYKTNSWWSCVKNKIKGCGQTCLNALINCPKDSWVIYLGCVAIRCGGCYISAAACCACDCKWWCKWAVGCCKK